jgi:glycogen debranching enzyme
MSGGGWAFGGEPVSLGGGGGGVVTLINGSSFCVGTSAGDLVPELPHGLFVQDTRFLSRWQLRVDRERPEPLTVLQHDPDAAEYIARTRPRPGRFDTTLMVQRTRRIGDAMAERIVLRNLGREAAACTVSLAVGADFADIFEVKESRVQPHADIRVTEDADTLTYSYRVGDATRAVHISADGDPTITAGQLTFRAVVPAHGEWGTTVTVQPVVNATALLSDDCRVPTEKDARLDGWRRLAATVTSADVRLTRAIRRSTDDLGALRIVDPGRPDQPVVAAGAPWFMALFGRDSIFTSWMTLLLDQELGLGTAQTLAAYQATDVDALNEAQPGRILHEMRFSLESSLALGGSNVYYGTADATPLFVMLLGELARWGVDPAAISALLPAADAALDWVAQYGDRDGDGFVEYLRMTDRGLLNQGWKDSWDGVNFADGRTAEPPIALAEVQAYVYGAYRARAALASDPATARGWEAKAAALKVAFNDRFWLADRGWLAIALDRDKRPVDGMTSNIAHCLWTGIVDDDKAAAVAKQLLAPEMFAGFGVRTLSSAMAAYNPLSYHNGSVWPHDNAIVVAGLMRYGFVEEAQRVAEAVLAAAESFGGRLPELFCGFGADEYDTPIRYPTSCSPQAWAAAAPVHMLRSLLRLEPDLPAGVVSIDPAVPDQLLPLRIAGVPLGGARVTIDVTSDGVTVDGLPDGVRLVSPAQV